MEAGSSASSSSTISTQSNMMKRPGSARGIRQASIAGSDGGDSDDSDGSSLRGVKLPGSSSVYATSSSCVVDRPQLIGLTRSSQLSGAQTGHGDSSARRPWLSDWRLWLLRHSLPLYSFSSGPPLLLPAMRAGRGGGASGGGEGIDSSDATGAGTGAGALSMGSGAGGGTAALAAQVRNVGVPDPPSTRQRGSGITKAMLLGVTQHTADPSSAGALSARYGGSGGHHVQFDSPSK